MISTKQNHLEFSKNEGRTKQNLLFDESPFIYSLKKEDFCVDDRFYSDGYTLQGNINSYKEALSFLERFIANINTDKLPLYSRFLPRIQLAKVDKIPVCQSLIKTTFQALHFDMGQPIISESSQTMYLIIALYCTTSAESLVAKTRVVSLKKLLSQKKYGDKEFIEKNLIDYVKKYGDGWTSPDVVNTLRISCFARILDAVSGLNKLTDQTDKTTGEWFLYEDADNDLIGLEREYEFYRKCGFDLEKAEEQILLKPGELLIIDNMRAVHGRIGKRRPEEIYQFMFGVKSAQHEDIDLFRNYLVDELAC